MPFSKKRFSAQQTLVSAAPLERLYFICFILDYTMSGASKSIWRVSLMHLTWWSGGGGGSFFFVFGFAHWPLPGVTHNGLPTDWVAAADKLDRGKGREGEVRQSDSTHLDRYLWWPAAEREVKVTETRPHLRWDERRQQDNFKVLQDEQRETQRIESTSNKE